MTEITAPKSAVTAEQFADEIREQLKYTQGVTVEQAKPADVYVAASAAVRRHLVDSWMKTQADMVNGNTKAVGYLSAEFLMGKQLENALLNAGLTDQFDKAVEAFRETFVTSAGKPLVEKKPDEKHTTPVEQEKIVAGEK
jgi:starch phosphorylase